MDIAIAGDYESYVNIIRKRDFVGMLEYMKGSDEGRHARSELNEIIKFWKKKIGDVERILFFAIAHGNIVGISIGTVRAHAVFVDVIVSKEKGAGKALMEAAIEYAAAHEKHGVELTSTPKAYGFYKRIGFRRGPLGIDSKHIRRAKSLYSRMERIASSRNPENVIDRLESSGSSAMKDLTRSIPDRNSALWYAYSALQHKKAFGSKMFINKNEQRYSLPKYSMAVDTYHQRKKK